MVDIVKKEKRRDRRQINQYIMHSVSLMSLFHATAVKFFRDLETRHPGTEAVFLD